MKKLFLSCVLLALIATYVSALDITLKDGTVYKNAKVTNVMPNAIGFMYTQKDGTVTLRDVKLELLTKDLQKKFNYSPKSAKKFETQVAKFQAARQKLEAKHHLEDLNLFRKQQAMAKELDHIKAALHAHRIVCWVHIIRAVGDRDCIAKVSMPRSSSKFGHLGKVYVRGLTGAQNERIGVTLYPTGKSKSFQDGIFPVYDANLNHYALQILKEKEKEAAEEAK